METFYIDNKVHLGDNIVILILAYNRAIQNNWIVNIYGNPIIEQLFELYDFYNLKYCGLTQENHVPIGNSITSIMPQYKTGPLRWDQAKVCFLKINHMFRFESHPSGERIKSIVLPKLKINKTELNNVSYFQFDSRSLAPNVKRAFTHNEMDYIIKVFGQNRKVIGLGGPNTIKYIPNYEFEICSSVKEIYQKMINCHSFMGIDSGLSHVAGSLGIKSNIILCEMIPRHQIELIEFYKIFYNINCFTLSDLESRSLFIKDNISNKNKIKFL